MASSVVSRAAGLGALTAAGQLIIIGSLPTYSRVFDPGAYGEYLIFVGAVAIVSVFAGLRYDSAIVLPRDDRIASRLSALVMLIALAVALLIAGATLLGQAFAWAPDGWLGIERDLGYGLAAATVIGAAQRCLSSWCIRGSRFFLMGLGLFIFSLVTVVAQLSLVRVMSQLPALIWGYVCALGFQSACLATLTSRPNRPGWARAASYRGLKIVARKYRRFPRYMVGYALASSARDRLVQIMLGIGAGAAVVGRFGLAYRVAFAPNSLIYSAISPIFFGIASRGSPAAVGRFAAGLVEATFVVMVVPYVALAIEAPALTDGLLSYKWHGTGPFLQALAGPALLLATTCWLDRAFDSFRRQKVAFTLEASFTSVSVVLVAVLSRYVGAVTVTWAFGILAIIYYWTYFLMTFVACAFPLADFRRACVTGLLAVAAALSLGVAAHQIPALLLRLPSYAVVMAMVILWWIRFRGGAEILRLLMRSRVGAHGASG
jgi:O-antigen/teichoic acid export membrane protein